MALIVAAVLAAVWSASTSAVRIAFLAFWLGGVVEAVTTPGAGAAEKAKGVGTAKGAVLLGCVGFIISLGAIM
jgi:hypothetical protein